MKPLSPAFLTGALCFIPGVAIKIPIVCVVLEGGPGTLHVSAGWLGRGPRGRVLLPVGQLTQATLPACHWDIGQRRQGACPPCDGGRAVPCEAGPSPGEGGRALALALGS